MLDFLTKDSDMFNPKAFALLLISTLFWASPLVAEDEKKDVEAKQATTAEADGEAKSEESAKDEKPLVTDPELRKVILEIKRRRQIEGDQITMDDLRNVWSLDANNKKITDLTGLEHCINLGDAKLAGNSIKDVAPLATCQSLQLLDLAGNQVADPSPLGTLKKLQYLNLENNQVGSLSGIENCEALNSLYAAGNNIEEIGPVAKLKKLWSLDLSRNKIKDISPVAQLTRLSQLGLAENQISDVSAVPPGNGMYSTYLSGNQITDITPLVEMAAADAEGDRRFVSFWRLYLSDNPLSDGSKTEGLEALKAAGVRLNPSN